MNDELPVEKRTTVVMVREDDLLRLLALAVRHGAPWETEVSAMDLARDIYAQCGDRNWIATVSHESPVSGHEGTHPQ